MNRASLLCLSILASSMCAAQTLPNPGGMAPDTPRMETGDPPKDHANTQDKLFVRQVTIGNRAEVELGKLAQQKGASEAVRDFAKHMQSDHQKSADKLSKSRGEANPSIPKELDPAHVRTREELSKASGKEFDAAYFASQVQEHQKAANLMLWEIGAGQSAALTKYAAETLPTVMDHLEIAKQQHAALTSGSPPER